MAATALIACDIFADEMKWVLDRHPEIEVETIWIGAGLHNDLDILKRRLDECLAEAGDGVGTARLLIGSGCHPDMRELVAARGLSVLPTKNCLGALVGEARLTELERDRTMVVTPAWIRKVWFAEDGIRKLLGWDNTDFRINFGIYDRILVMDFGLAPLSDEEILDAFSVVEVPIECESFDLGHFERVFLELLS
ncbi:MAG: DUF1638 domain-containing protein [Deltaproteobacteria bacterium]|nr:DUF1638 domain-containing protein [Deltaproteobacteria bacterium]